MKKYNEKLVQTLKGGRKREFILFLSSQLISKRIISNFIHELSMTSVWIDVIDTFWQTAKRKLSQLNPKLFLYE